MEFRCIHCGFPLEKLMVQYSPGNIRLAKCENCRAVADEYIECEIMIVLIDLILHKKKAYRHLLFNVPKHHAIDFEGILWKLMIIFLLLDLCRNLILYNSEETARNSFPSIWLCGKILIQVFAGNFAFFSTLFIALKLFHGFPSHASRCKEVLLAIVISSYLRTFIITMMVWEFPSLMLFIIDIFVLSSNAVALKVLTQLTIATCVGVCLSAHTARLIASHVLWGSASFQF
ncbi:protein ARV 2-like isoform X2 [Aristolochia californica]|uniref:protein ARV 2-like isoform X2 n=1 Tax=Aristolochia californica TaxID=171875 RepID=UPI0035DC53AC